MKHFIAVGLTAVSLLTAPLARADVADHDVLSIVLPFAPGGHSTDPLGRFLSTQLQEKLGKKAVIVLNKPGAGGIVGSAEVAHGPADGATMLFSTSSFLTGPAYNPKANYHPLDDFKVISVIGFNEFVMVGAPEAGISSLEDLLAKAKTSQPILATGGVGSSTHFVGILASNILELNPRVLHMKSGSEAMLEVIAGRADYYVGSAASAVPYLNNNQGKAILYLADGRRAELGDVPNMRDKNLPAIDTAQWYGIFVPDGVSDSDADMLHEAVSDIMKSDAGVALTSQHNLRFDDMSRAEFQAYVDKEYSTWVDIVKAGLE